MKKYVCLICGYVYDEEVGDPERKIAPGTKWSDVPEDWVCPLCGATKAEFKDQQPTNQAKEKVVSIHEENIQEMRELSYGELSALCSNLAKGCEKQYRTEEAELFNNLSEYYKEKVKSVEENKFEDLLELIQRDLSASYLKANIIASDEEDRGALRALTWGEKVTRILNSILLRYEKKKDSLLENTNIYVCEICGFIYIGEESPDICPVCKVPNMKIVQVQRG